MKHLLGKIIRRVDERLRRSNELKRLGFALFRRFPIGVRVYTLLTGRRLPGLTQISQTFNGWSLEADPRTLAQWNAVLRKSASRRGTQE